MFAKRLHADESHLARLASVVTDISIAQSSAGASASADGGGSAGTSGPVGSVSGGQPSAAPAVGR
eukprot:14405681-Alexandrium_andersonii.AAC.1